jgi:hypothetical protein
MRAAVSPAQQQRTLQQLIAATTLRAAQQTIVIEQTVTADLSAIETRVDDLENGLPADDVQVVTADYAMTPDDRMVLADATAGPITVTLPSAATGGEAIVKKVDASANSVTVDGLATQQIDGLANAVLATQDQTIRLVADGLLDWYSA